ncbi:LacI family DNA-binding transcriptional regulator [Arthrobacter sp. NPDC080031]|uniref:LacI family DNA-binding transcriptional regulator n=1 Tax=Arthrobacter sp. NPDC080031 TaxID=3155918 RepID=UPI00344E4F7F
MAPKRVTLADVAKLAGLSTTAASMILNGRPDTRLSKEAHERVLAAAAELNYRPNVAARGLRTQKTRTIGFISDRVATTRFASGLIEGALAAARAADHVMLVLETGGEAKLEASALEAVLDRQVDGIIFASMRARELHIPELPAGTRSVLLNATSQRHAVSVLSDEYTGGRTAVEVLARHKIADGVAVLGYSEEAERGLFRSVAVNRRVAGIKDAVAEHGIDVTAWESVWLWEADTGYVAAKKILRRHPDIRALLCMNDRLAFGAYQALQEKGLRIPDDVSLVSFDNDELASYLRPGLTTVALPHEQMGRDAVSLLLSDDAASGERLVPMPLIERSSVIG